MNFVEIDIMIRYVKEGISKSTLIERLLWLDLAEGCGRPGDMRRLSRLSSGLRVGEGGGSWVAHWQAHQIQ